MFCTKNTLTPHPFGDFIIIQLNNNQYTDISRFEIIAMNKIRYAKTLQGHEMVVCTKANLKYINFKFFLLKKNSYSRV